MQILTLFFLKFSVFKKKLYVIIITKCTPECTKLPTFKNFLWGACPQTSTPPPPNSARCIAPRDIPQAGYVSTPHALKVIPLMFEHEFKPLYTIMGSFKGSWVKSRP